MEDARCVGGEEEEAFVDLPDASHDMFLRNEPDVLRELRAFVLVLQSH